MPSTVITRLITSISANVYGQIVTVCTQLIGVPVLLHYWGGQLYGEWLILSAIPVYLSIADLGYAQSAGNDMTQRVARGDFDGALTVFQSTCILIVLCSLTALILVCTLLAATPLTSLLPTQEITDREAAWVIGLLSAEVLILINEGTLHAGFRASGGYAVHTAIYSSSIFIQNALLWICAVTGGGVVSGAAAFLGVRLVVTPMVTLILLRRNAWITIGITHVRWMELRKLFRPAIGNLAFPLAQALNIQGMRLAIGAVLGPIAVITFATIRTLTRIIFQASTTIGHASEPEMAAAYGNGNFVRLKKIYIHGTQLTAGMVIVLATMLCWAGTWILEFWTHGKVVMDAGLFGALVGTAVASALWYSNFIVLKAANRHLGVSIIYMIASGMAVFTTAWMLSTTGRLSHAGFILLLMDISLAVYVIPVACQLTGINWQQFINRMFKPF